MSVGNITAPKRLTMPITKNSILKSSALSDYSKILRGGTLSDVNRETFIPLMFLRLNGV